MCVCDFLCSAAHNVSLIIHLTATIDNLPAVPHLPGDSMGRRPEAHVTVVRRHRNVKRDDDVDDVNAAARFCDQWPKPAAACALYCSNKRRKFVGRVEAR